MNKEDNKVKKLEKGELLVNHGDTRDLSIEISELNTEQLFTVLKNRFMHMTKRTQEFFVENIKTLLDNVNKTDQKLLKERLEFQLESLDREKWLLENGYTKYIDKNDLYTIIDELDRQNSANVLFVDLENFTKIIPNDVVKKIAYLKENKIFDKMYIMYSAYDIKSRSKTERKAEYTNSVEVKAKSYSKDPILFGEFRKDNNDNKGRTNVVSSTRMYVIAEWDDEYCHLNIDAILNNHPGVIKDIYGISEQGVEYVSDK